MATDEKLGKNMLFPLAERMVVKFVNEGKIEAEAGTCNVQYNSTVLMLMSDYVFFPREIQKTTVFIALNSHNIIICH